MTELKIGNEVLYDNCGRSAEGVIRDIDIEDDMAYVELADGRKVWLANECLSPKLPVDPNARHRVFVYGTLKSGLWNNPLLHDAIFAGPSVTPADYKMLDTGFPVLIEVSEGNGQPVAGELYHVDDKTLQRLDRLESVGRMYDRKTIHVVENGEPVTAFIYIGIPGRWAGLKPYTSTNERGELDWNPKPFFVEPSH